MPLGGLQPRRVLVVEDNPVNQRVATALLRKLGYEVDVVGDGRQALELSGIHSYAAIFMDCMMPEVDGYQATLAIRQRETLATEQPTNQPASDQTSRLPPGRQRTPIIAMTASTMPGDRERCFAAGMDDFIAKPVRLQDLRPILDRWVP